jgi:hypothetical protein
VSRRSTALLQLSSEVLPGQTADQLSCCAGMNTTAFAQTPRATQNTIAGFAHILKMAPLVRTASCWMQTHQISCCVCLLVIYAVSSSKARSHVHCQHMVWLLLLCEPQLACHGIYTYLRLLLRGLLHMLQPQERPAPAISFVCLHSFLVRIAHATAASTCNSRALMTHTA